MMLGLAPQRVRMDLAQAFASSAQSRVQSHPLLGQGHSRMGWHAQDLHASGDVGRAASADAQRGQDLLDAISQQLAHLLRQLVAFAPLN